MTTTYQLRNGLIEEVVNGVASGKYIEGPVFIAVSPSVISTFTQTYSTAALTVPALTYAAPTVVGGTAPAGGVGAAAGGWDTAGHRDTAIATITQTVADVASLNTQLVALAADVLADKKLINSIIDVLQASGFAG